MLVVMQETTQGERMAVRKKNTIFSIWTLCALLLLGTVGWFAYLYRNGIEMPSFGDVVSAGSSEFWTPDNLVAQLKNKGLEFNAVKSAKEEANRQWTLYLFLTDVDNPAQVAGYFDQGGPDAELAKYHGVRVEKCFSNLAAGTRASSLGSDAYAWGSYVIYGDPDFVTQIRQALR
jgi:hypothetical protein